MMILLLLLFVLLFPLGRSCELQTSRSNPLITPVE